MHRNPAITVGPKGDRALNGLGMMILQYLEQNLAEFDYKVRQGLGLRGRVSVEVEKHVAITLDFTGKTIEIENGVIDRPDLHLKSSYILLSKVLTGSASPLMELLRGNIKLGGLPRRPIQAWKILRFLKLPPELLVEGGPQA